MTKKTFQFCCPQGHSLEGDPAHAGMQTQCPICGVMFIISPPLEQGVPAVPQQESEPVERFPGANFAFDVRGARSHASLQLREWTYVLDVFFLNVGFFIMALFVDQLLGWLFLVAYGLFKDCFSGKSPAKALTGLRVVDAATGKPIGVGKSIARNWIFLIPLFPLVELVVANCRPDKRRLGDLMADTIVIRD